MESCYGKRGVETSPQLTISELPNVDGQMWIEAHFHVILSFSVEIYKHLIRIMSHQRFSRFFHHNLK